MIREGLAVAACSALGIAAALASQVVPDLRLVPGQSARGEIVFDGEEDRIAVDLLAGSKLTVSAKASKKSKLKTALAVRDAGGAVLLGDAPSVKSWTAPATATYLVAVHGTVAGPTGLYDLTSKLKPAPKPAKTVGSIDALEIDEIGFDALPGTVATITLKDAKGSELLPRVRAVVAPDATTLALDGAKRKSTDRSDTLKALLLPQFGRYVVRVEGGGGSTGGYTLTLALKAPAVPKAKPDFRGASGGEASAGGIASVEIEPRVSVLARGASRQMLAKATYADGRVRDATRAVTWAVRDPAAATAANGASCGLVTAGAAFGGTVVEAWAGPVEARSALLLRDGDSVAAVAIVPLPLAVAPGDSAGLSAVATLALGGSLDATTAADWAAAGGVPVTFAGPVLTAGATPGAAQVTATVGVVASPAADVTVTIRRVERIAVAPAYAEISSGSVAFTATATFSDGSTSDVTATAAWASDDLAAATMTGATAAFVAPGTAGIRATLDGVTSRPAVLNCGPVALQSIAVHGAATVPHGAARDFTADGVFADGGTRDVTEAAAWSSSAPAVVSAETAAGVRGRATGLAAAGPATITASVTTGAGVRSGQAATAGAAAERASLFVVPRIASIGAGSAVPVRAFARRSDGTLEDVTALAAWATTTPSVATVAGGVATAVADGGAVVSASLDGRTASSIVLVGASRIQSVAAAAPPPAPVGDSATAGVALTFSSGPAVPVSSGAAVSWRSSDPLALPVRATGAVSARRPGTADLIAVVAGVASAPATATAAAPAERSLRVFPQTARGPAGADVQLAAQVTSSDGSVADRAATSAWDSATPSKATVNTTGFVHAVAKGTSTITASRPGLADSQTFTVLSDPPSIASVSPPTLARGATGAVVTIDGANLDGAGLSVSFSGTGVTATAAPTPNGAGTQATVPVDVNGSAALTARDVTYTTASGSATKTGAVTITSVAPTIASVAPSNVDVPPTGSVSPTIVVTGTNFATGDGLVLTSHAGVSVSNISVVNSTTMSAQVTVQSFAQNARVDVKVVQSPAAGGQTATLVAGLKIGPADPTVTGFTPAYFLPGVAAAAGTITGTNFNSGIAVSFAGSSGNFTYSATRQSPTLITFQVTAASNAAPGLYDLVLQNTGDIQRTFTGLLALVPKDPAVSSFSAASLSRGVSNAPVVVVGSNFASGDGLSASGTGVTFSSVTVVSPERITANASVAANATISTRDLSVSHAASVGGRSGTLKSAFRVTDATPMVTSCNPSSVGRTGSGGPTRRVPVTVAGTNFCDGAAVAVTRSGGSGLTVVASSALVLSDTQLAFDLDVAGAATVGSWDVKVTNPGSLGDSGTSGASKLGLVSETTLAVNRVVAGTGSALGGDHVTVYGAGFVRGCETDFGTQKALATQFIDQNTLVTTVPAPANPASASSSTVSRTATTYVDVKVTNNPGQGSAASATLTGGYGYLANATVFKILQSYPADSSTGNPQTLRSAVVRLSDFANTGTAVIGTTQGTNCQWYESGGVRPTGPLVGFGADRRFLVFSRTSTGNLAAISPPPNTGKYVLETPTAVKSASGAPLVPVKLAPALAYDQWLFTISTAVSDTTAPTLSSSLPAGSATGVATNTTVALTFSEEIDPLTVTATSITLKQGTTSIGCDVALSNDIKTVTLTPFAELAANTQYTVSVASTVADLSANAISATSFTFTTGSATDTTAPTVDAVVFEQVPADMDGSGTYVAGTDTPASTTNSSQAFDLYLPKSGWKVVVLFSDTGGAGVDETQFSAKASVAVGAASATTELASKFSVSSTRAEWTVASADAFAAGEDVTLTFFVKDKSGNTSASKVVTFDVVDINATALGGGGGDLDPFDTRETWVLRFDRDVYTASLSTNGTTQQCTTTAASNGVLDLEEGMRISGLATANMTTDAANTVNGASVGTNAIVVRLVCERIRATLRARYGIGEDGSRGADAPDIEFLLPGEQGALSSLPQWSSTTNGNSAKAFSEMDIGGDTGPNSSLTGTYTAIGFAYIDPRNRNREADMNDGLAAGNNNGIFAINMAKAVMNSSTTSSAWGIRVLKNFQTAKGGTPIGEGSLDDDVLAGTFDRTSASNTAAMNDRYDKIMDAIESSALSVSSVAAHEIGHSLGLVPDGGPKTGLFGNAPRANTFTEATATFPNTSAHLNALGNDVMAPVSSVDQRTATGSDFMRFSAYDRDWLLHRQVHDEGR